MTPEQENMKAWSILTKSRGGTVSVIRDLTLDEAKTIYERLHPWYGHTAVSRRNPKGVMFSSGGRTCEDGDIVLREVFGPPFWDQNDVKSWGGNWPKHVIIDVDEQGRELSTERWP